MSIDVGDMITDAEALEKQAEELKTENERLKKKLLGLFKDIGM